MIRVSHCDTLGSLTAPALAGHLRPANMQAVIAVHYSENSTVVTWPLEAMQAIE